MHPARRHGGHRLGQFAAFVALVMCFSLPGADAATADPAKAPSTREEARLQAMTERIAEAARQTQQACQGLIHHDTYAYEDCVLGLLQQEPRATPRRLGIEYFGYVGAMNSERMGMEGAEVTAYEFLRRLRVTQRRLRIDDLRLCATVPGDCQIRVARMKQMIAAPAFKHPPVRDREAERQHVH